MGVSHAHEVERERQSGGAACETAIGKKRAKRKIDTLKLNQEEARRSGKQLGVWRNGSASDSRSEGWEFESLCPHFWSVHS